MAPAAGGPVSPQRRPGKGERGRRGWVGSRGGGEADLGPGSGRERVEWGLGVEAVGGGAMGATASSPANSWGQGPGFRV